MRVAGAPLPSQPRGDGTAPAATPPLGSCSAAPAGLGAPGPGEVRAGPKPGLSPHRPQSPGSSCTSISCPQREPPRWYVECQAEGELGAAPQERHMGVGEGTLTPPPQSSTASLRPWRAASCSPHSACGGPHPGAEAGVLRGPAPGETPRGLPLSSDKLARWWAVLLGLGGPADPLPCPLYTTSLVLGEPHRAGAGTLPWGGKMGEQGLQTLSCDPQLACPDPPTLSRAIHTPAQPRQGRGAHACQPPYTGPPASLQGLSGPSSLTPTCQGLGLSWSPGGP